MKQQMITRYPAFIFSVIKLASWQQKLLATSIASMILAISANISIPTSPVPFTLQSLAVLLVGAFLGRKLGIEDYFQRYPMNFLNIKTKKILPYWVSYYKQLKKAIPQGFLGSHPQQLLSQIERFKSIKKIEM